MQFFPHNNIRSLVVLIFLSPLCLLSCKSLHTESTSESADYKKVVRLAEELSRTPYRKQHTNLPESIINLSYDQYRKIIPFRQKSGLWEKENLPFIINFYPLGTKLYTLPVKIYEIDNGKTEDVKFNIDNFIFDKSLAFVKNDMPKDAGYAGFRIVLNRTDLSDFAVFLGSSYFRILSEGSSYGLSTRGLAIDTGLPGVPEEFPVFEQFWIEKPKPFSESIKIYALLNSKSVTGAYAFTMTPGDTATVKVKSTLFFRNSVQVLGLAPMTSMFWFDETTDYQFHDYRPQVHNSDGLIISQNNDVIWKPLVNYPDHTMINNDTFSNNPDYFGLLQRTRNYNSYMDPGVKYQLNPSAWVTPDNSWKDGNIRLFQLPTKSETDDNINAFWIPGTPPVPGEAYNFDYTLHFSLKSPQKKYAYVKFTNKGIDEFNNKHTVFTVSYAGNMIKDKNITAKLEVSDGVTVILEPDLELIPYNNTLRAFFILQAKKLSVTDKPYILKCTLYKDQTQISETWYYQWYPLNN